VQVSEHFAASEFACHDGTEYPKDWIEGRLTPLCNALEVIRAELGGPVQVLSGYRSPKYNAKLAGSAKDSQHMYGRAADIRVKGVDSRALHDTILRLYEDGKIQIGGLGSYPGWVHVDIRENKDGRLRRWRY
jgi:uncharacterized protein YcbK (DUF882 family)